MSEAPQPLRACDGCGKHCHRVVVWGLRVCGWCAKRINYVTPSDVVTGIGWWIAVSALCQWLREANQGRKR